MSKPLRFGLGLLLFLALAGGSVLAHSRAQLAWQLLGSCLGVLALALLVVAAVRYYPYCSGRVIVRGHKIDLPSTARRVWPAAVVILTAIAVLAPLILGQMPLSHDHPVHLYKAWHFWDEMVLRGRLRGWSSYWFFGYPAEELYPIGPDLWVAAFRVATLGLLSWEATYGLAFVGVFAFAAYAVYSFGRRSFGATAGVIAGLAWILDMGDYREGGWSYTVDWAVWVQVMAMGFALLALGRLQALLDRPRPRAMALAGLLFGAALLSHPMNVLVFAFALPLLLLARALAEGRPLGRELALSAGALGLGVAVAGFWFLPMLGRSAWTTDIGDLWRPLGQTVKGLLDGTVFANVWPVLVVLGLVGAALGVAMRRATAIFLLCLAALLLFLSSSTAFEDLSLMTIAKYFAKIQYQRLVIPVKACLYLLAGLAVAELATRVALWRREAAARAEEPAQGTQGPGASDAPLTDAAATPAPAPLPAPSPRLQLIRRVGIALLLAVALSPFVRPALLGLQSTYLKTVGGLVLKKQIHYWQDYQDFLRWSAQKRKTSDSFYRISYELDRHNHLMMGAPAHNRTPYYKVGYTPARLYKHVVETTEDPVYRALSVAYIVSLGPLGRPNLELEQRFGSIHVYRYKDYQRERYTLTGAGRVAQQEFGEERIRLTLHGTAPGSRLKVHVANYARWRARMNGRTVPISEAPVYGTTYPMLMEVPVEDGELVFDYVLRPVDWLGTLATLLGIAGLVLLVLVERREKLALHRGASEGGEQGKFAALEQRLGRLGRLAVRIAAPAALVLALALGGFIVLRLARGGSGLEEGSLAQLLPTAEVTQAGRPCAERKGRSWYCTARSWNYVGPSAEKFNGAYLPCIWAHPVDEGPLSIRFPRVRLGRAIVGNHGIADGAVESFPGGAPVTLEVRVDGRTVERLVRPNEKGWAGFRVETPGLAGREAELTLIVSTQTAGGRHYCFDARIDSP